MISEVIMPQMGADMKEGTILRWLKAEGDQVTRGEAVAEIETDKANVEIEAFESGVLRSIVAHEGQSVPVGNVIAVVASPDEDISRYEAPAAAPPAARGEGTVEQAVPAPTPSAPQTPEPPRPARQDERLRASPVARRLAEEAGIDLASVHGTGPDGRIVKRDIEAARGAELSARGEGRAPTEEDTVQNVPLTRMRETIARRMQQSKQTAPHYYLSDQVDMTEALRMRVQVNEALGDAGRVSVNDVILLATARTLLRHPRFNAHWREDSLELHSQINLGLAVALDEGLVVPAIVDCGRKGLAQIAGEARDVAERARHGSLSAEEFAASTFTISNLGAFGIETLVPIINPPQVGILGIGAVREKPVVRGGEVVARHMMSVVLAGDHRATDGAEGARFLATLRQLLETPSLLLA
ncbi:MAG: hypothetical protein GEU73_04345 [Chloroflexi bacterium]|nr:hypothetical protein [Chloroflexota bacterium]